MAEIFMQKIALAMANSNSPLLRQAAEAAAKRRLNEAAAELKNDFESSDVTKELDGGTEIANISRTLRGEGATENLFSFIGFTEGEKPTEEIRKRLEPGHPDGPYVQYVGKEATSKGVRVQFKAGINEEAIYDATPLPWAKEMSWARKIEGKIQGFASFLDISGMGRSGGGIQATVGGKKGAPPQILRDADYVRPEGGYLQTMFRRFRRRLQGDRS